MRASFLPPATACIGCVGNVSMWRTMRSIASSTIARIVDEGSSSGIGPATFGSFRRPMRAGRLLENLAAERIAGAAHVHAARDLIGVDAQVRALRGVVVGPEKTHLLRRGLAERHRLVARVVPLAGKLKASALGHRERRVVVDRGGLAFDFGATSMSGLPTKRKSAAAVTSAAGIA